MLFMSQETGVNGNPAVLCRIRRSPEEFDKGTRPPSYNMRAPSLSGCSKFPSDVEFSSFRFFLWRRTSFKATS